MKTPFFHNKSIPLLLLALLLLLLLLDNIGYLSKSSDDTPATMFDGERAYQDVIMQVNFGPRVPNSDAHNRAVEWVAAQLREAAWEVEIQKNESIKSTGT